jgi:membrane-associated phospholipid phosphatase
MLRISGLPILALTISALLLAALLGGGGNLLDLAVMDRAQTARAGSPQLTGFVVAFTQLGGAAVTLGVAAIAVLLLSLRRRFGRAALLAATVLAVRLLVDRPRPPLELLPIMPHSLAFPSGHAANSMATYLAVAILAVAPIHRRPAVVAAAILSLLIGLSRVWLGVHWPSDVIGGWALGLLAAGLAVAVGQKSGAVRLEPQHEVVGGHGSAAGEDQPT